MASVPAPDLDIRLEDYLDDKLQAAADLASLPQLLATVDLQRDQLQSQLDDADAALNQARLTAQQRRRSLQEAMDEFRNLQESIDARVEAAAASDAPNQAIARLELPMKKLRMVDLAHRYLSLLRQVYQWRTEALSHLPASPKAALEPYSRLRECALSLKSAQGDELLHLVDHVEQLADSLWSDMKATMSAELQLILSQRDWPRLDPGSEMDQPWIDCLEKLVDLQLPEILHATSVLPLLPMDVMASIFIAEFRFHFLSDKPTSSLQAVSSHCFPWFLALIEKWEPFFRDNLAHLLAAKFGHTPVAAKAVYLDPSCAFITSMLPVMREKVGAVAAQAADNPSLLSAFVSQLMTFDDNIRSRFDYDGGDPEQGWAGLTDDLLRDHFESWFQAERRFALDGFDAIMESQEARKIDYDFSFRGKMKPTFAAVRVTDLLRAVTSKYERLRKLTRKTRFLTDIQLDILDAYHDRLRGSLEAYQSMTSTLGRTLHGVSRDQLAALQGIGALETLCKVIGSADHVANTLAEWSDEEVCTALLPSPLTRPLFYFFLSPPFLSPRAMSNLSPSLTSVRRHSSLSICGISYRDGRWASLIRKQAARVASIRRMLPRGSLLAPQTAASSTRRYLPLRCAAGRQRISSPAPWPTLTRKPSELTLAASSGRRWAKRLN